MSKTHCLLLIPDGAGMGAVVEGLNAEGACVTVSPLSAAPPSFSETPLVLALLPSHRPADAVEAIEGLVKRRTGGTALIACVSPTSVDHTRALEECGANEVINPETSTSRSNVTLASTTLS